MVHIVEFVNDAESEHKSSGKNRDVHDLMRGAKHVESTRIPPFRELSRLSCYSKYQEEGFFEVPLRHTPQHLGC